MTGEKLPLQEMVTRYETNRGSFKEAEARLLTWFKEHTDVANLANRALLLSAREAIAKQEAKDLADRMRANAKASK